MGLFHFTFVSTLVNLDRSSSRTCCTMELLAQLVSVFHGLANTVIFLIICMTTIMSVFLYKVIFQSGYFSSYDRNL